MPINYAPNEYRQTLRTQMEVKIEKINLMRQTIISLNKHLENFGPQDLDDDEVDTAINLLIEIEDDESNTNTVPTVSTVPIVSTVPTVYNSQHILVSANLDESNQQQNSDSEGSNSKLRPRTYSIEEVGFIEKEFSGNHQFILNVNIVL